MLEGGRRFNRSLDRQKIFGNKPVALDRYHPKQSNLPIPRRPPPDTYATRPWKSRPILHRWKTLHTFAGGGTGGHIGNPGAHSGFDKLRIP